MDTESLIAEVVPRLRVAQAALYTGDVSAWARLWSSSIPISWLGQFGTSAFGETDVASHFRRVAARDWAYEGLDLEVIGAAVMGDHGYLVTREFVHASLGAGEPPVPPSRVSRVLHRKNGEWFVAHGHADLDPLALDLPWRPPQQPEGDGHGH